MAWLFFFLVIGLAGFICLIFAASSKDANGKMSGDAGGALMIAFVLLVMNIVITAFTSIHIIDAREVGVVKTFGSITGQVGEGIQLTWPWQNVDTWDVRLQVVEPDTKCSNGADKCMDAGSVDVQDVYVTGVLNIEVEPRDVQELARNIGKSYKETVVLNRLNQVVKETTARYKAADILAKREEIRETVRTRMADELSQYSISVTDFLITNIDFRDEFKTSIENKVKAEQDALAEANKVEISKAQAAQAAAQAQGRADSLRIEAEGQAEANKLINQSLTPALIQFQAIQKLNPTIQTIILPAESNFLLPSEVISR